MTAPVKAIPELSLETQLLERLLLEVPRGEVITYRILSAAIDRDVQYEARHYLTSARRRVLRKPLLMLFEPVRGIGMKRVDDSGKIAAGEWHNARMGRQAKLSITKVSSVEDFAALPRELQVKHNVLLAQAGMVRHLLSERTTKKLTAHVEVPTPELPLRACLAAMKPLL